MIRSSLLSSDRKSPQWDGTIHLSIVIWQERHGAASIIDVQKDAVSSAPTTFAKGKI
jgi:hypothetical protein